MMPCWAIGPAGSAPAAERRVDLGAHPGTWFRRLPLPPGRSRRPRCRVRRPNGRGGVRRRRYREHRRRNPICLDRSGDCAGGPPCRRDARPRFVILCPERLVRPSEQNQRAHSPRGRQELSRAMKQALPVHAKTGRSCPLRRLRSVGEYVATYCEAAQLSIAVASLGSSRTRVRSSSAASMVRSTGGPIGTLIVALTRHRAVPIGSTR
jgi:hypothetical protein